MKLPLASDWLRRPKDQQDEFGCLFSPSEVETQQADESAFVSMFDDVKQVDPGNGIYDQAERLKSGEGDRLRQREAGMRFWQSTTATKKRSAGIFRSIATTTRCRTAASVTWATASFTCSSRSRSSASKAKARPFPFARCRIPGRNRGHGQSRKARSRQESGCDKRR